MIFNTTKAEYLSVKNADKDESRLVGKLEGASKKLDARKLNQKNLDDAIQKQDDYIAKIGSLIAEGKIARAEGSDVILRSLIVEAEAIKECINGITEKSVWDMHFKSN